MTRNFSRTGWILLFACLAAGIWYSYVYLTLPMIPGKKEAVADTIDWLDESLQAIHIDGSVFRKQQGDIPVVNLGPLAQRFRLAGTFFAIGVNQQARKAIIDDLKTSSQQLVSEGEILDKTVKVVSIFPDCVVLREGNREEQLWLSFSDTGRSHEKSGKMADSAREIAAAKVMLNRFGKRVGDTRWVLRRNDVMNYYQELLNDTERLASVFESLKPVYRGKSIAGYVLDVEGEQSMFHAFGLKQDDIIRKANSMPMTSRVRAEYFIREFVEDRANAFVLDIERDGKLKKLIYMIR